MNDSRTEAVEAAASVVAPSRDRRWVWGLLLLAGIAAAAAVLGYGQPELLLEAVNLRYCG